VWLNKSLESGIRRLRKSTIYFKSRMRMKWLKKSGKRLMHHFYAEKKNQKSKCLCEMKKIRGWFNPEASRMVETLKPGREIILDLADITMMMLEVPMEPRNFDEAFNHSVLDSRTKWWSYTAKEFREMHVLGVWKKWMNLRCRLLLYESRTNGCLR
jgi:hypothetical protein